jgi:hypothetical protein
MATTCWDKPGPRHPYPRCAPRAFQAARLIVPHMRRSRGPSAAPLPFLWHLKVTGCWEVFYDRTGSGAAQATGRWVAGCRHERCVPAATVRETHARHKSSLRLLLSVCGPVRGC